MPVPNARQLCGQGLTASAFGLGFSGERLMRPHFGRLAFFGQARFAGDQVRRQRFIEEVSVAGDERFALDAEFHAAQVGVEQAVVSPAAILE